MKKVVIIGGGFAGSTIAKALENKFDVTLVDTKDFFEFTPGILRTIVEPKHMCKIHKMYKDYLKKTKVINEEVKIVDERHVLFDGKRIRYDYLVICSGSSYKEPIKEQHVVYASRAKHLINVYNHLMRAKNVAIIGGGIAGVELASEIVCKYPEKKIILIHADKRLMHRNSEKSSKYAEYFLKNKGVEIILGEKVVTGNKNNIMTDKKREIKADIVLLCTRITPNSSFIKGKLRKSVDEKGFIDVNEKMQVQGFRNVFSAGDVNSCKVEKTAQNAEHQAKIVVKNIMALENGGELKTYNEKKTPMIISLGKWDGIFEYNNLVFTSLIPAFMKWIVERKEMMRL